jgi:hypothetical protein
VRRTRPAARHRKNLTGLERATGWRYAIVATNITRMRGIAGSHHPQWLDALHRSHATVEDTVRTNKAMGLRNLPSKSWTVNQGWVLAANIAADLAAWTRLLGLHDQPDLTHAEPETLRYRLLHLPATLSSHARQRVLKIPKNLALDHRVHPLLATPQRPTRTHLSSNNRLSEPERAVPGDRRPGHTVVTDGAPTPHPEGQNGQAESPTEGSNTADESRSATGPPSCVHSKRATSCRTSAALLSNGYRRSWAKRR